jgi:hypothetical protein
MINWKIPPAPKAVAGLGTVDATVGKWDTAEYLNGKFGAKAEMMRYESVTDQAPLIYMPETYHDFGYRWLNRPSDLFEGR